MGGYVDSMMYIGRRLESLVDRCGFDTHDMILAFQHCQPEMSSSSDEQLSNLLTDLTELDCRTS